MPYKPPKSVPRGSRGPSSSSNRDSNSTHNQEGPAPGRILSPNALRQAGLQKGGVIDTPLLLPASLTSGRQNRGARGGGGSDSGRSQDGSRPRPSGGGGGSWGSPVPFADESWPPAEFEERKIHGDIFKIYWNRSVDILFEDPKSKEAIVALAKLRIDVPANNLPVGTRVLFTVHWESTGSNGFPKFYGNNVREVKRKAGLPFLGHLIPTFSKMLKKPGDRTEPSPISTPAAIKPRSPSFSHGLIAQRCQYNITGEYESHDENQANFVIHQKMKGEGEGEMRAYFQLDKDIAVLRPGATKPEKVTGKELIGLIQLHDWFTLDIMSIDNGKTWEVENLNLKPERYGDSGTLLDEKNVKEPIEAEDGNKSFENALMSMEIIGDLINDSVAISKTTLMEDQHLQDDVQGTNLIDFSEARVVNAPDVKDLTTETDENSPSDTTKEILDQFDAILPQEATTEMEEECEEGDRSVEENEDRRAEGKYQNAEERFFRDEEQGQAQPKVDEKSQEQVSMIEDRQNVKYDDRGTENCDENAQEAGVNQEVEDREESQKVENKEDQRMDKIEDQGLMEIQEDDQKLADQKAPDRIEPDESDDDSVSTVSSSRSLIAMPLVQYSKDLQPVFPQEKIISIADLNANIHDAQSPMASNSLVCPTNSITSQTEAIDKLRVGMEYVRLFYRFIRLPSDLESEWLGEFERTFM